MNEGGKHTGSGRLDRIVADAQRQRLQREADYREKALRMYPWVCGRCGREFDRSNVRELTVHHRDHDHDNNPEDGSNWELLCRYCHDNEHARLVDQHGSADAAETGSKPSSHRPFADLDRLLKGRKE
jgi:5-methylcytosine-specific restriction endonuclease McrA